MELEPRSAGSPPTSPSSPGAPAPELPRTSAETTPAATAAEETLKEDAVKPDRRSSSSSSSSSSRASSAGSMFHLDAGEMSTPLVAAEEPDEEHAAAAAGGGAEAKPDDWASWPEQPTKAVDEPFLSDGGGTALAGLTQAPEAQTMAVPAPAAAPAADNGFNPERIPASIFQPKSSSQAEWSIASNESLFSIHGASQSVDDLGGLYSSSRSHFDYFYDEAMAAAGGGGEPDWKLPPLAEGSEFAVPDSAGSDASAGSRAKKAIAFRRHESGSIGSSSNFSFAFPILAETSPRKRESAGGYGYYKLQKEYSQPASSPDPVSVFEEMTTEAERRRKTGWCWCGECCGCCWFDCSWSSCCSCCGQWRRCCCSCSCSCPSFCWCNNWCL